MKSDEVQKIGRLARLLIGAEEAVETARTLSDVLQLVRELEGADLESVKPLSHPLEITQRLRDDRISEGDCRDAIQTGAPRVADGLYLVPKVIEGE